MDIISKYKDITYMIIERDYCYCAYIIINKNLINEDSIGNQEITYFEEIKDCDFVNDKSLGKYVLGWDYAHNYNYKSTFKDIKKDIKIVIDDYINLTKKEETK